jgi:hypothetical protein
MQDTIREIHYAGKSSAQERTLRHAIYNFNYFKMILYISLNYLIRNQCGLSNKLSGHTVFTGYVIKYIITIFANRVLWAIDDGPV